MGCGPGPTTEMLLKQGARGIVSVDFSIESLKIKDRCQNFDSKPIFVCQDLRSLGLKQSSASLLVMADFLQHIVCREEREKFLNEAFSALIPGGRFFLSFFNINLINYLKGDVFGDFCSGKIPYQRFHPKNIIRYFPQEIIIEKITPMNIFNNTLPDRILTKLPLAILLSRMVVVTGFKRDITD